MTEPAVGAADIEGSGLWRDAEIIAITVHTPTVKSFLLQPTTPTPFLAGQHLDVRLTAPDGYAAIRSYSISSSPDRFDQVELTIERLSDGEVSPYFHDVAAVGDVVEVRGPFTRHFVWEPERDGATLLVGGGSGVAPLMSMLRYRLARPDAPHATLVYSARTWRDVIFRHELLEIERTVRGMQLVLVLTREPESRADRDGIDRDNVDTDHMRAPDYLRRVDEAMMRDILAAMPTAPRTCFVCGNNGFVSTAAAALLAAGIEASHVRTERYGE